MAIEKKTYPKDLNLPLDFGHAYIGVDVSATNEFDSDFLAPLHVQAELDFTELSFP